MRPVAYTKQEDEEGGRQRREKSGKKRSLHVATYLRLPRAAASPASFRDEIVSAFYQLVNPGQRDAAGKDDI